MRLFTAILLDEKMKDALTNAQDEMRRAGIKGNYTKRENLHLTIAFIGEYGHPEEALDAIRRAQFPPFQMSLSSIGFFPGVLWAGIDGKEALASCAGEIRNELEKSGIPFDRKKFLPHITIVRKPVYYGRISAENIRQKVRIPPAQMTAGRVSLMVSERGERGMVYTEFRG